MVKRYYPFVVSVFVLIALLTFVDLTDLLGKVLSIEFKILAAVFALHIVQVAIVALRWRLVLGGIRSRIPYLSALRYQFMAVTAGLFMPASIGTGAAQAVLANDHIPMSKAVNSAIIDRYIAGISMVAVTLCIIPFAPFTLANFSETNAALIAVFTLVAFAVPLIFILVLARTRVRKIKHIRKFLADIRTIGLRTERMAILLVTSICGTLLYIFSFFVLARYQGLDIGFLHLVILMPPVMLAAAMPISYGGWGIREGGLVAALSLIGIPAVDTIAISVQQGVIAMLPGVLGGILWTSRSIGNARRIAESIDTNSLNPVPEQPAPPSNRS